MQPDVINPETAPPQVPISPKQSSLPPPRQPRRLKKPILFASIAILLICGAAYGAYSWEHSRATKTETSLQSQLTSLSKQVATLQKTNKTATSTPAKSPTTTNPYAGWKTYTLPYEKLTFQYPPTWTLQNEGRIGYDFIELASSDGFSFSIEDGSQAGGDGVSIDSSNPLPVTYIGASDYLVFVNPASGVPHNSAPNTSVVGSAILLTDPNNQYSYPDDKNVTSGVNGAGSGMYILMGYNNKPSSIQAAQSDPEYLNGKLVVQSMHY